MSVAAGSMLLALVLDAAIGWPTWLYARIGHPVTWIGALIDRLDQAWNRSVAPPQRRRLAGLAVVATVVAAALVPAAAVLWLVPGDTARAILAGVLAWPLIATRSLYDHVAAVARPLAHGSTDDARTAVAMIVGRDPAQLDDAGIARAALESLAENTSDGVTAPLFWGLVAGLPGIAVYKAINTMDSMIGHRTPRHEAFGWAAARLDDLVNWVPARLTGALFAVTGGHPARALRVMWQEAPRHRSPNAGWPEAAMAASLGVRLSGPRIYADRVAQEPWLNGTAPDPTPADLSRGLAHYRRAMALVAVALAVAALL